MSYLANNGKTGLTDQMRNKDRQDELAPRFPRLQDCAHFHYEHTEFGPLRIRLSDDDDYVKPVIG